jgi:hypothetical protein
MPPVPAQLVRKNVEPADTRDKKSTFTTDGLNELAIAQSQVDNFLSDIKTITLTKAVQHAIASAGSNQTESSETADQKDEVCDEISPTSRVYNGHLGVRRRIAMTKRFTQLKDTMASDEGAYDPSSSPTRRGNTAKTQSCDEAAPLSPRSAADKASRERTRQLGARLMALAKRNPGLAKAVEARGLVSSTSAVALSSSVRSPSDIETLVAAPAKLSEQATNLEPRSLEQQISSKRLNHTQHSASGVNRSLRSGTLTPSPALGQPTASFNASMNSISATVHDENTPRETVASSQKIGASPVSARKGRAAAIGSQQRRRRALSSIGNQQAVLQR